MVKNLNVEPNRILVTYEAIFDESLPLKENEELLKELNIEKPYLLYVGNAYPHKNLERLARVFKKLVKDDRLKLKLVLVGKEDYFSERLKKEVVDEGISQDIIFTGFIKDRYLALLYQHALLFVFPSLAEGFGLPPLEAMSHGLPVVSSNATCLPEILGEAANYFNPKDDEEMRQKMKRMVEDDDLRKKFIKKGFDQVKKYSWGKLALETKELYERCL
ncbi:MAG: Glycosyl transferase, group 1 [uncultured bacterium]|nr:MAG: Glycosyl transferase, group 1 [uncultured bacterium]